MPTSQNGYSANDRSVIASLTVPGTTRKIALRKGDTSVILLDIMAWIHAHIESIDTGIFDDWGYAERTIRGSATTLSNHASGTAVDANAVQHPLGVRGTWSAGERNAINGRLGLYDGCIRWGDNYSGRVDGMHFEIDRGAAACRAVADRIRDGKLGGIPVPGPVAPPPPPPPPARLGEDHEMHVYSPEPAPGTAKNAWPTRTVTYGFVPEDAKALHLQWGSRGGWIHRARWWVRDPNWTANIPKHFAKDHPIGTGGSERFIGYGWIAGPPAGADCLELTFSAPDGVHIVPAVK